MIIHLFGPDTYRSRARLHQLRDAFVAKHDPQGFNVSLLDGATATSAEIRAAVSGGGLFAKKNFIGLNGYEVPGAACPTAELTAILKPMAGSADTIVVVRQVTSPAAKKKGGRSKKTTGSMELHIADAKREEFPLLTTSEARQWCLKVARERGATLTAPVADQLVAATDNDAWRLATELEKLIAFAGDQPITAADVSTMVPSAVSSDMFALTDAMSARQRARALGLIQHELEAGVHPLALIAMMARHLRTLRSIQRALEEGIARPQLAASLGLHPFVVSKAVDQIKKFEAAELRAWHHYLVETDYRLKSTPLDAEMMLDLLMVKT